MMDQTDKFIVQRIAFSLELPYDLLKYALDILYKIKVLKWTNKAKTLVH